MSLLCSALANGVNQRWWHITVMSNILTGFGCGKACRWTRWNSGGTGCFR